MNVGYLLDTHIILLIAQSIAGKYTIISSDFKFPFYKEHGLKLLVN